MSHRHHHLNISNLSHSYDAKAALKDISLNVCCGQRLALLGPNGAGKSTLIRLLAGLLELQDGTITWANQPITSLRREIAYLPQVDHHQRHFPIRVRDVVAMGRYPHLGFWKSFRRVDREKTDEAISRMHLGDIADRQIDQLSGGQQQRTFIARALAQEAHIILLDEPFNGLDVESRCHLSDCLIELSESSEHLIIGSHHQLETVTQIFTHALVLECTQVAFDKAEEIMANPEVRQTLHRCHP